MNRSRRSSANGVGKDSYLTVQAVDRPDNSLILRTGDGRRIEASPAMRKNAAKVY